MTADPVPTPVNDDPEDLPPLSVLDDILNDVLDQLEAVSDIIVAHRRAARDDHHAIARLQDLTIRTNDAWIAVQLTRKALRP